MRVTIEKLLAIVLLTVCFGVQLLEASGHWDRTLKDTNNEGGLVVIVLCVGIAIGVATAILKRVRPFYASSIAISFSAPLFTSPVQTLVPVSTSLRASLRI